MDVDVNDQNARIVIARALHQTNNVEFHVNVKDVGTFSFVTLNCISFIYFTNLAPFEPLHP